MKMRVFCREPFLACFLLISVRYRSSRIPIRTKIDFWNVRTISCNFCVLKHLLGAISGNFGVPLDDFLQPLCAQPEFRQSARSELKANAKSKTKAKKRRLDSEPYPYGGMEGRRPFYFFGAVDKSITFF